LIIKTVAIAIAMIIATVEAARYISVGGKVATGIGDGVGTAVPIMATTTARG